MRREDDSFIHQSASIFEVLVLYTLKRGGNSIGVGGIHIMIEGRLKAIVANLLGDWIESDKLDLSINIWNDENVRFENVNLKDTVIPVSAPFRLKAGLIGSLTMNIPFKTFGTTPAKITLTDVLVVLSPRNLDDDEKAQELEALKDEKKAALEKDFLERILGPQMNQTNVAQEPSPPTSAKDAKSSTKKKAATSQESQGYYGADGFFGRLVTRLMDNLHIEFKNVHIRFEGTDVNRDLSKVPRSLASGKYAIGCSIGALYAETTGSNWIAKSHNEADPQSGDHVVLKLIQATNMSAYVDPHALHFVHSSKHPKVLHATLSRLKAMADPTVDLRWWKQVDGDSDAHTHRFVLAPFHVTLKLTMNIDIQADKKTENTPHYNAQFELSRLIVMLDDEQVVLAMRVIASVALHDQWRQAIAQRVRSDEREHYTVTLKEQYMVHWAALHKVCTKQSNWDIVKKSDAWKQLQTLEKLVSIDAAIAMRNDIAFEGDDVAIDSDMSRTSLHDLGEALGIPAPQINVKFQRGKDIGLKMYLCPTTRIPVVDECFGQAKVNTAIKPGLLLVKVDGHDVSSLFSYTTVDDLYQQLSARALTAAIVLTFRHPGVQPSQVTPSQLVSHVDVAVPHVEFVDLSIRGFGPGWFSFHRYRLSARHFYLQESVSSPYRNHCLASSIDQIKHPKDVLPIAVLEMNFLETDHPSLPDKSQFATQYGVHIGDLIFIYERTKVLAFTVALADFCKRAFPPAPAHFSSRGGASSTTSSTIPLADIPLRIRYDFSIQSLRVYVKAVVHRQRATRAESVAGAIHPPANRSIFSQLTLHKAHGNSLGLQDWLKDTLMLERVVASVIHLQRYVRGRNIRRFALPPPRPSYPPDVPFDHASVFSVALRSTTERQGYLYVHDYRLGSRRWVPLFFVLEKSGLLRVFRTASCAVYVASYEMENCVDVAIRVKDDSIIAPYFAKPMSFMSIKWRTTHFVTNAFGINTTLVDTVDLLVASADPSCISMWHFVLNRYKSTEFDVTTRTPLPDSPIGIRKCTMDVRGAYRGWLFRQDCTLAFRRWHEHYVYLDESGQLRFYEDNTGRVFIDEEFVENITSVVHVGNIVEVVNWEEPCQQINDKLHSPPRVRPAMDLSHLGPAGESDGQLSYCIEVTVVGKSLDPTTKPSSRSFLLASFSFDEVADWRHILWEKRMDCRQDRSIQHLRRPAPTKMVSWPAWWRAHLGVRFSNTAKPNHNVRTMYSNLHKWISLYTNHVSGTIFFHDPAPSTGLSIEQAGAILAELRMGRLEVRDRRSAKPYCLVYVGDTFLEFERGKLKAVAINSEQLQDKGQMTMTMQFCGPQMEDKLFGEILKPGLCLGLQFSGCILPNSFQQVLTDALHELAPMWEDANQPPAPSSVEPFLRCEEITLDIRVGMFEAYIEEKHCVAKFLMEGNELSYGSSTDRERLHLALGSTSLHVMTSENQLRLAQIDGADMEYELAVQSLDRMTSIRIDQVKLEADGRMRVLYQLFEALQLFDDDDEPLDDYSYDNISMAAPSPLTSPVAITAPVESMRPRHVRNESGVSIRSQRSLRGHRSQTGRNSEFFQTLSYIQPLLTYQTYLALLNKYNYTFWSGTKDTIHIGCRTVVFEVVKRSLSLVALDTYIPVMKFSVNEIQCSAQTSTEFRADFEVDASVTFSARYYNTALADWEPVVEPWEVAIHVTKPVGDGTIDTPKPLTMDFKARHRLNINFTEALVRLVVSVSKHHKSTSLKNSERMLPSSETSECVSVINNLGVAIRLANLNTTNPGVLTVEIRDGWSLPAYTRFHDATVEVILLPWWNPQERSHELASLNHAFHLSYGGANAGVAPKLRLNVRLKGNTHDHGSVELNLAGNLMGTEGVEAKRVKFCQWHRLRDPRGVVTGEVLVALHFTPTLPLQKPSTVQTVLSGGSLMVDPFRLGSGGVDTRDSTDGDSTMKIKLPESIRNGYVPPLALEVMVDGKPRSLLCPLQRAGKFFIKGEGVLAEVKVAQRDELRRVLMLSSPKQVKNATRVVLNVGAFPLIECDAVATTDLPLPISSRGRSISFSCVPKLEAMVPVNPGRKYSLPLGALYSDNMYGVMVQVQNSKRTKIAELATLQEQVGCHILYLAPLHDDDCGYCLFMEVLSHVRNVYREEQFDTESSTADIISHDAKYQIQLHAGFVFENALPIRLKYKLEVPSRFDTKVVAEGTLAPGDEVELLHFHKQAYLYLCAPDEASSWSSPISLAKCISQEGTTISNQTISRADEPEQRRSADTLEFVRESPVFNDLIHNIVHLFTARLDYTVADNGSPRTVIYCSVWIYNYSHVNDLLARCADNTNMMVTCPTMKDQPNPRLMDCAGLALELNTVMNHEPGRWSERIHAGVVGVQKSLTLKGIHREKHEVGVAIQRPLGQFHRTAQVIISSRYVVVNYTRLKFIMASEAHGRGRNVEIAADTIETPFDYPGDLTLSGKTVCLKAGGGSDRNYLNSDRWSGLFSVENEDEFTLWLPGAHVDEYEDAVPRIRVKVHTVGATILIKLSRDDPPMLSIRNDTNFAIKLFQVNQQESLVIPPNGRMPFAWESPDSPRFASCRRNNQATHFVL
ncbi:hypothetical protein DYB32_001188 [Aphanomyces invadans]|uniref:PH domain-containing protein n=1 Tax=Aphanomyces invadans TaxID=157072 RepID=A0A3R7AEP4_9STRA|nr:hypothetical protein DYB32_001188 [Aphanomyces invadans]